MPAKATKKVRKKATKKKTAKKKAVSKKATTKKVKQGPNAGKDHPEGYVFGRPTKYKPEMCQQVITWSETNEVVTLADICCKLMIGHDTLIEWQKKHPDFSKALKIAEVHRMRYMEQAGLSGMNAGKNFNAVPWLFMTKNMFPKHYSDRKEIELSGSEEKPVRTFAFNFSEKPEDVDKRGGDEVE